VVPYSWRLTANLNPRSIEPWEQGVQVPTVSNLKQLARALNVGFEALSIVLFAPDDSTLRSLSGLELMRVAFHKTLTPPSSGPLNVTLIELSRSLSTLRSLLGGDPITFAKQFEQFLPQVNAALRTTMDAKSKVALRRVNAWAWIDAAFFFLREKQYGDALIAAGTAAVLATQINETTVIGQSRKLQIRLGEQNVTTFDARVARAAFNALLEAC
jgi:transcriptional regulator with XRE-family HTH domain